jgi:hypothetical protein
MHGDTPTGPSQNEEDECVFPPDSLPPGERTRYSVERDPEGEEEISTYVEIEAPGETVQHVERIKAEFVLGDEYVVWDVTTDKNSWWVISNLTNLYSKAHFPSLDFVISFHVGLMMRLGSRPESASATDPNPFDEVFRRQGQAHDRIDRAVEAEDFQAVGMMMRECLLSLTSVLRRRTTIDPTVPRPQDSNFIEWAAILFDALCGGRKNKELRQYLKGCARDTWQLVNWLTHEREATKATASIVVHACDTLVGHSIQLLERARTEPVEGCPICRSRRIRTFFDPSIDPDGDYYISCAACGWNTRPRISDSAADST